MPLLPPATNYTPATAFAAAKSASPSPLSPHYLIFFGSPDESGRSWCPDCQHAEGPLGAIPESNSTLVYVGDKQAWRDPNNEFRQAFGLKVVPTVLRVESVDSLDHSVESTPRLEEAEILDEVKLKKFLE